MSLTRLRDYLNLVTVTHLNSHIIFKTEGIHNTLFRIQQKSKLPQKPTNLSIKYYYFIKSSPEGMFIDFRQRREREGGKEGEGERQKDREKHPSVASHMCPNRAQPGTYRRIQNLGMCTDQGSNLQPFGVQDDLARDDIIFKNILLKIALYSFPRGGSWRQTTGQSVATPSLESSCYCKGHLHIWVPKLNNCFVFHLRNLFKNLEIHICDRTKT